MARRSQLYAQLAASIQAGLTLTQAMEMAARSRYPGLPRAALLQFISLLKTGHTFGDCLAITSGRAPVGEPGQTRPRNDLFPEFDQALLTAGEEAGQLDASFRMLARYYESRARIIRETMGKLAITFITLHVFLVVFPVPLLVMFVKGIVDSQYLQCVPFLLEKLLVFGILYGALFMGFYSMQDNRGNTWRSIMEQIYGMIPGLAGANQYLAMARLAMALNALQSAGVNPIRSWEMAAKASGSPRLQRDIMAYLPKLEQGHTPADMVNSVRYIPEMFANLFHSGEISGRLDDTLERLEVYFEAEGFRKLQTFATILNLLIYFTIAFIIACYIIGFYTSYYNNMINSI